MSCLFVDSVSMKRLKGEAPSGRRFKFTYLLLGAAALYLVLIFVKFPDLLESVAVLSGDDSLDGFSVEEDDDVDAIKSQFSSGYSDGLHSILQNSENNYGSAKPQEDNLRRKKEGEPQQQYGRITAEVLEKIDQTSNLSQLERVADEAYALGLKAWEEVRKYDLKEIKVSTLLEGKPESCPSWVSATQQEFAKRHHVMFLPCGLAAGSSITVVGTPRYAHEEYVPQLAKLSPEEAMVLVSQFKVELQGLKSVDGEDPPRILHLNPRVRGDWSHRSVIEHNTCYRMQWGTAQRCDGSPSKSEDDMLGMIFPITSYLPYSNTYAYFVVGFDTMTLIHEQ